MSNSQRKITFIGVGSTEKLRSGAKIDYPAAASEVYKSEISLYPTNSFAEEPGEGDP